MDGTTLLACLKCGTGTDILELAATYGNHQTQEGVPCEGQFWPTATRPGGSTLSASSYRCRVCNKWTPTNYDGKRPEEIQMQVICSTACLIPYMNYLLGPLLDPTWDEVEQMEEEEWGEAMTLEELAG